jgi:hypothetical protein
LIRVGANKRMTTCCEPTDQDHWQVIVVLVTQWSNFGGFVFDSPLARNFYTYWMSAKISTREFGGSTPGRVLVPVP